MIKYLFFLTLVINHNATAANIAPLGSHCPTINQSFSITPCRQSNVPCTLQRPFIVLYCLTAVYPQKKDLIENIKDERQIFLGQKNAIEQFRTFKKLQFNRLSQAPLSKQVHHSKQQKPQSHKKGHR